MKKNLFLLLTLFVPYLLQGQVGWTQKANFPGGTRYGANAFTIGTKGYVGMGYNGTSRLNDLWEYDPGQNSWAQKAALPATGRYLCPAFAIGTKGYVCLGATSASAPDVKDIWQYDAPKNAWTLKEDFPGNPRYGSAGFALNGKGYICCGNEGSDTGPFTSELWEYTPGDDSWVQKKSFPGSPRSEMTCSHFIIGNKAYVGLGGSYNGSGYFFYYDLHAYDPSSDSWTQITDYPGRATGYATGFSSCAKGFMGTGSYFSAALSQYWQYDPNTNAWKEAVGFPATGRYSMVSCVIQGKAYAGTGSDFTAYYNDWWEYNCSATTAGITENNSSDLISVYPDPSAGKFIVQCTECGMQFNTLQVYNTQGKKVFGSNEPHSQLTIDLSGHPKGVYFVRIVTGEGTSTKKIIISP